MTKYELRFLFIEEMKLEQLQEIIAHEVQRILNEGGWTSLKTQDVRLTPLLVKSADQFTKNLLTNFNAWLANKHPEIPGLNPIRPVGSGIYYEKDIEEEPDKIYGDIDYLIEYPVLESTEDDRKNEVTSTKFYNKKLFEFFREAKPDGVDIGDSKGDGGTTAVVIAEVEPEKYVQIDFVVTHKQYADWAKSRFTPIRNIKGFVSGGLYAALAEALMLSIGDRGARAKLRNGVLVPYKLRKDTEEQVASLQFDNLFQDIVDFLVKTKYGESRGEAIAAQIPGIDVDNLSIESIAAGIRSLAVALEKARVLDGQMLQYNSADELVASISQNFIGKMDKVLSNKKFNKADTEMAMAARDRIFKTAEDAKNAVKQLLG